MKVILAVMKQLKQLQRKPRTNSEASTGFEPMTYAIPVRCSTDRAMKPHFLFYFCRRVEIQFLLKVLGFRYITVSLMSCVYSIPSSLRMTVLTVSDKFGEDDCIHGLGCQAIDLHVLPVHVNSTACNTEHEKDLD